MAVAFEKIDDFGCRRARMYEREAVAAGRPVHLHRTIVAQAEVMQL
jgi:hypothetical protein